MHNNKENKKMQSKRKRGIRRKDLEERRNRTPDTAMMETKQMRGEETTK